MPLLGERPAAASPNDGEDFRMTGEESLLLGLPLLSLLGERPAAASPSDGEDFRMTGKESLLLRLPLLSLLGERPAADSPSDGEDFFCFSRCGKTSCRVVLRAPYPLFFDCTRF